MRIAPRARPGKRPARTAGAGKFLHFPPLADAGHLPGEVLLAASPDGGVGALDEDVLEPVVVIVGCEELDLEVVEEAGEEEDEEEADTTTHALPLQLKPAGQHFEPQVCRVGLKSVVNISLPGCAVAFCWLMSQLIGLMVEQSLPMGQQKADLLSLKAMHVLVEGQQKLLGRAGVEQATRPVWVHVSSALSKRPTACTVCIAAESAGAERTAKDIRHTAISLRNFIKLMIISKRV